MVARPPDYDQIRNQITQREEQQNPVINSSVRDSMQSLFSLSSLLEGTSGPMALSRTNERMETNPSSEVSTSLEPIRQSLLTMHTLLSTMGSDHHTRHITSPSSTRNYFVGQWLDVKDTVNQWLEATVMQVDHEQDRVFIHYNGWSVPLTRLDSSLLPSLIICQAHTMG
jgi:hypothetical protein